MASTSPTLSHSASFGQGSSTPTLVPLFFFCASRFSFFGSSLPCESTYLNILPILYIVTGNYRKSNCQTTVRQLPNDCTATAKRWQLPRVVTLQLESRPKETVLSTSLTGHRSTPIPCNVELLWWNQGQTIASEKLIQKVYSGSVMK